MAAYLHMHNTDLDITVKRLTPQYCIQTKLL